MSALFLKPFCFRLGVIHAHAHGLAYPSGYSLLGEGRTQGAGCPSSHPLSPALLCCALLSPILFLRFARSSKYRRVRISTPSLQVSSIIDIWDTFTLAGQAVIDCLQVYDAARHSCLTRYATHHPTTQDTPLTRTTSNGSSRIHCEKPSTRT